MAGRFPPGARAAALLLKSEADLFGTAFGQWAHQVSKDYYCPRSNYHAEYECKLPSGVQRVGIYMSQLPVDVSLGLLISSV